MYWQEIRSTLLKTLLEKSRIGLVSDFDGTLSPIVEESAVAHIAPGNRELLQELCEHLPLVAIVSGRAVYDLQERVSVPELVYVGNHGLERWSEQENRVIYPPEVLAFRPEMEAILQVVHLEKDMRLEDKDVTISIHYRQTKNPEHIEASYTPILQSLADKYGLRFSKGRMVFEIRPPLELNKGTALASLVHEHQLDGLMFIGDDVTDADAMDVARRLRDAGTCYTVNIGVESPEMAEVVRRQADALATGTSDVTGLLAWFLEAISSRAS